MNQFFTLLPPKCKQQSINYDSEIFLLGSCFVENIGGKLAYHKLRTTINPFGIVFHPIALENLLSRIVEQRLFSEADVFYHNEQWHCFEVHSELSHSDKETFIKLLNAQLKTSHQQLKKASHVVLTFGTAWGYLHKESNQLVANCHKIPQQQFEKQLSSTAVLEGCFKRCFELIQILSRNAQIITTISPVRHIKDGVVENNRSKANLLSALHQSIEKHSSATYYPAYELVMDCLRDYRFYEPDLIHPNQVAIDYIWEHFMHTWLHCPETQKTLTQVAEIQKGLAHKAFNPGSKAHQKFRASLQTKIDLFQKKFPFMKF